MWENPPCLIKIVGKRLSIVEDTPGVTRDRIYAGGMEKQDLSYC